MQPYMGNFGSRGAFWGSDNPLLPAADTGGAQIIAQNGGVAPKGYVEIGAGTPGTPGTTGNTTANTNIFDPLNQGGGSFGNTQGAPGFQASGSGSNPLTPGNYQNMTRSWQDPNTAPVNASFSGNPTLPGASNFSGQGSGPSQNSEPPSPVMPPNPNGNNMFGQPYVGYNIYDPLGQGTGSFGPQQTSGKQQAVAGFGGPYQDTAGPEGMDTYGYTTPQDKVTNALFGLSYGGDHFGFPKGMFNKL